MKYNKDSKNVLVLEDSPSALRDLGDVLRKEGYVIFIKGARNPFLKMIEDENDEYCGVILDNYCPYFRGEEVKKDTGMLVAEELVIRTKYDGIPENKIIMNTSDPEKIREDCTRLGICLGNRKNDYSFILECLKK